jgi:hypothetical protein
VYPGALKKSEYKHPGLKNITQQNRNDLMRTIFSLIIFAISGNSFILNAQMAIGEWRSHLPYSQARRLVETADRVYCGTRTGLFYFEKQDNSLHTITRIDGLSDVEISAISYTDEVDILVITYVNANLDIIRNGQIKNIPDIKRKQIMGNKTVNDIMIHDKLAYLSCGFGIVVVNLEREEIKDTYYIGEDGGQVNVMAMTIDDQFFYAATSTGIYRADIDAPNLIDYNYWQKITDIPNSSMRFNTITCYNDRIYANYSNPLNTADTIYYYEDGGWKIMPSQRFNQVRRLKVQGDKLIVVSSYHTLSYDKNGNRLMDFVSANPQDALLDKDNVLWVADMTDGMLMKPGDEDKIPLIPNGPISNEAVKMAVSGDYLYAVAGGVTPSWNNTFNRAELNILQNNLWTEGFDTSNYFDLFSLAIDPADPAHVFAGSWGYGLFEFSQGKLVEIYRDHNSTLQTIIPGGDFFRLGGLCFDRQNNLWVVNSNVPEAVSVRKPDGQWKSFSFGGKLKDPPAIGEIIMTQNGQFWMFLPKNFGLFAFDINGTIDDESDDSYLKFDIRDENNDIISNNVFSLAEDHDGNIWVGTDKGIVVYFSPSRVLNGDPFYGQQILVPRNDGTPLADFLLSTETVTAITVDGANRKWVGTSRSGVFLLSEDGLEQIHNFTVDNSPLFSDNIMDIEINGQTGEVFFATEKGIISYKSTATYGNSDFEGVYVYPNPVREDYEGEIVITGMIREANIKITDIGGNIVFETTSLGGQAIWDGRTFSGKRVQTGVYLVFCTNEDGSKTHITKLLVIN